jgi:hypothetical protein
MDASEEEKDRKEVRPRCTEVCLETAKGETAFGSQGKAFLTEPQGKPTHKRYWIGPRGCDSRPGGISVPRLVRNGLWAGGVGSAGIPGRLDGSQVCWICNLEPARSVVRKCLPEISRH